MRFSYNKLFKLLIDKGIKKKGLCEMVMVSKLSHGGNVNSEVLLKICNALTVTSATLWSLCVIQMKTSKKMYDENKSEKVRTK